MVIDSFDKFNLELVFLFLSVLLEIVGCLAGHGELSCNGLLNLS